MNNVSIIVMKYLTSEIFQIYSISSQLTYPISFNTFTNIIYLPCLFQNIQM